MKTLSEWSWVTPAPAQLSIGVCPCKMCRACDHSGGLPCAASGRAPSVPPGDCMLQAATRCCSSDLRVFNMQLTAAEPCSRNCLTSWLHSAQQTVLCRQLRRAIFGDEPEAPAAISSSQSLNPDNPALQAPAPAAPLPAKRKPFKLSNAAHMDPTICAACALLRQLALVDCLKQELLALGTAWLLVKALASPNLRVQEHCTCALPFLAPLCLRCQTASTHSLPAEGRLHCMGTCAAGQWHDWMNHVTLLSMKF